MNVANIDLSSTLIPCSLSRANTTSSAILSAKCIPTNAATSGITSWCRLRSIKHDCSEVLAAGKEADYEKSTLWNRN